MMVDVLAHYGWPFCQAANASVVAIKLTLVLDRVEECDYIYLALDGAEWKEMRLHILSLKVVSLRYDALILIK